MRELVLFALGSSLLVEYEETCRRLGVSILAGVRNRPGPVFFHDESKIVDVHMMAQPILDTPCLCPLFTPSNRRTACEEAAAAGLLFAPALVDPTAIVASSCTFAAGSFVNAGCIVGAQTHVAEHVVINRGVSIGHHVEFEAFASVGPSAVICGHVTVETGAMIGAGAVVLPSVRVGAGAVIGAGSVVVADVAPSARVFGNPARLRTAAPAIL